MIARCDSNRETELLLTD